MHYYQRYIGDYAKDTAALSMLEDGAYGRLIDHYYATEKPLPKNKQELNRIAGAHTTAEKKAVADVLNRFFVECDDAYYQKRCDDEIRKYWKRKDIAAENGKKGGRPAKPDGLANGNPTLTKSVSKTKPNPNPTPNQNETQTKAIQKPEVNTNTNAPAALPPSPYSDEFEQFWISYPRKIGKGDAWKAWPKAVAHLRTSTGLAPPEAAERLAATASQFAKSPKGQSGEFCPHPATWLNGRRFEDDPKQWQSSDGTGKAISSGPGQVHPDDDKGW